MDNKTFAILIIIVAIGVTYYQNLISEPNDNIKKF